MHKVMHSFSPTKTPRADKPFTWMLETLNRESLAIQGSNPFAPPWDAVTVV